MARVNNFRLLAFLVSLSASIGLVGCGRTSTTAVIEPGPEARKKIQRALIAAKPGDVIELAAGKFELNGTISLDVKDVTIRGQGQDKTILEFSRQEAGTGGEGLLVTAGPITLEDLAIENARGDALKVTGADGVTIRRLRVEWRRRQGKQQQ